jgi:hypothetical protein
LVAGVGTFRTVYYEVFVIAMGLTIIVLKIDFCGYLLTMCLGRLREEGPYKRVAPLCDVIGDM